MGKLCLTIDEPRWPLSFFCCIECHTTNKNKPRGITPASIMMGRPTKWCRLPPNCLLLVLVLMFLASSVRASDPSIQESSTGTATSRSSSSGQYFELLVWMVASLLLLTIIVMWTCYWWAGRRLDELHRQALEDANHSKSRRGTIAATREEDDEEEYDDDEYGGFGGPIAHVGDIEEDEGDFDSIGSRPKVVLVVQKPVGATTARPPSSPRCGPAPPEHDDCNTTRSPCGTKSVGSMASYFRDLRWAARALGISNGDSPMTTTNIIGAQQQRDPPGKKRRFTFGSTTGHNIPEFNGSDIDGGGDNASSAAASSAGYPDRFVVDDEERGLGSYASNSVGGSSLYTTP
jgi:hypothetical protein